MKKAIILFIILCTNIFAEGAFYNLSVKISPIDRTVSVEGTITADFHSSDSLEFVLWKNTEIKEIRIGGKSAAFVFDTASASPVMYIPGGSRLTVIKAPGTENRQTININYQCRMNDLSGWANSFSKEWIEINFYCAWYPVMLNGSILSANCRVYIDSLYSVTGSGIVKKEKEYWNINQPWEAFDIVIIASASLGTRTLEEGSSFISADFNADSLSSADADSVLSEVSYIYNMFKQYFGGRDSTYLKFTLPPFNGGGYSRKNFVCIRTKKYTSTLAAGMAHEIGHFWWNSASASTWEDWLNESFSEYSMLLYIRERYGKEEFGKKIKEYKDAILNNNNPVIWGIERNSQDAYTALYLKGALILAEFEQLVGTEKFLLLLKKTAGNKISTTKDFLKLVNESFCGEYAQWFTKRLKDKM